MRTESSSTLLVSIQSAAKLLGISKCFLYRLTESGEVPSVKIGRKRLVRISDIEKIVEEGVVINCQGKTEDISKFSRLKRTGNVK